MRIWNTVWLPVNEKMPRLVFLAGLIIGAGFFYYFYSHGLTTAHYDAKAHLLVARRIVDSLEPGYLQMGAQWLPLIHLLYLPFIIFDSQYRSGFLPSLISIAAFAWSGLLTYRIAYGISGSVFAGVFAAAVLLSNTNLEYLQSCPLTEPLYMALFLSAVEALICWRESDRSKLPWVAAVWVSLGGLCRYEGWCLLVGVLALLACDLWTRHIPRGTAIKAGAVFVGMFGVPAGIHFGYIMYHTGSLFFHRVAAGNPDPYMTHGRPILSLVFHLAQISQIAAILPLMVAAIGLLLFLFQRDKIISRLPLLLLWVPSLINIAALYWGLVYRLRYSVLLVPAVAIFASLVIKAEFLKKYVLQLLLLTAIILPWISWITFRRDPMKMLVSGPGVLIVPAVGLILFMIAQVRQRYDFPLLILCILGLQIPPLQRETRPMLVETLEHEFIEPERQEVIRYLRQNHDGRRILIDMGRQAPLVYDSKIPVKDFIYNDGRGAHWHKAVKDPVHNVGWLCVEKGDAVWQVIQNVPVIREKYFPVVKTENFSLYRLNEK
jgi:hypothetical protein